MRIRLAGLLAGALLAVTACTSGGTTASSTALPTTGGSTTAVSTTAASSIAGTTSPAGGSGAAPADAALTAQVMNVVNTFVQDNHLRSVLIRVTRGEDVLVEQAVGESMTGVPATTDMHFRNGAVSIGYMASNPRQSRFFSFISLFTAAMLLMTMADNLLLFFMAWEIMGLCSYLLIGFYFEKDSAANAGKKAFLTTRIGDVG
ncbi:MAG TPA: proton-conducting transporter membrane subunit, partial [Nakamurella multipartita]|nr:proton-conducting transporter membrane subunit [Nakamurella multipartita]